MKIFGIGTDITEVERIRRMVNVHGDYFVKKVYTAEEIAYCQALRSWAESYTGRWCVKESVLKALGTGWVKGMGWRDMEVRTCPSGQPVLAVGGGVREFIKRHAISDIMISISHSKSHATAVAVAFSDGNSYDSERLY